MKFELQTAAILLALILLVQGASAHEPLFGLGPHTVGQYSWALETELERDDNGWQSRYEALYGVTPDVALTVSVPYVISQQGQSGGIRDIAVRGKYRFIRRDVLNASTAFALHGGIRRSKGDQSRGLGTGTTDYFGGLSFGHESRSRYAFAGLRYQVNGSTDGLDRGDVFNIEAAYGLRPWQLEYTQPDPVFLVELLGQFVGQNDRGGVMEPNTGGATLSVAPGILFSYRNVMLKAGIKIPLFDGLNGSQSAPGREFILAVDVHMPPFK